ncbi:hypothetical protein [Variovorax sp. PBL-E5]|nr:hypothetical protein [Variovorax sp. PBL-E5]VTU22721.1 hypothetical protein E5CHR_01447 [Variovorax sp. PBL-E5]
METSHAKLQPQDPFAARLGLYMFFTGVVAAAIMAAASMFCP